MNPKWLFEADVFEDNTDKMIAQVKRQGMDATIIPYVPFDDELLKRCNKIYLPEDCVIFYGSLNFGKKLRKASWVPGVYLNEKAFECTSYYPVIGDLLLHYNDFIMLPYGSLKDKKALLFDTLGTSRLFIRPNSGTKEFTGFVTIPSQFDDAIELAGFYDVEPELLVMISGAADLLREWRFVVVDGKVISGSLYRWWGGTADDYSSSDYVLSHSKSMLKEFHETKSWREDHQNKAWDIAQECADRYNPDRAWTIDVCQTIQDEYKILEIGCFSCAGMYANNLSEVVKHVSKVALAEWEEYFKKE